MPLILGTNSIKDTGYDVANSCRFNDGSSDSLNKTPSSNGTRTTWTFSIWLKRSSTSTSGHQIFDASPTPGSDESKIYFYNDFLYWKQEIGGGGADGYLVTNRKFRDVSAWYNIICQWNTTSGTESERMKIFVNGVQETSFSTANYPDQNRVSYINSTNNHYIGSSGGSASFFDGYMTEIVFVDGTALDQTSFGEFDSDSPNIWKPKDVSGLTFGTNGFHLDFENASSLGADVSGNSNNFTVNNLTSVDQSTDTCTNNFATLNPLKRLGTTSRSFEEGNLRFHSTTTAWGNTASTISFTQGKWYAEVKIMNLASSTGYGSIGLIDINAATYNGDDTNIKQDNASVGLNLDHRSGQSDIRSATSAVTTNIGNFSNDDILGLAVDMDNKALYIHLNGTYYQVSSVTGVPTSGSSKTGAITIPTSIIDCAFQVGSYTDKADVAYNFGSPFFSISSGNSDANGHGNFEFSVPSGYYALNTKNLAEYG